jgi:hypothetical protein
MTTEGPSKTQHNTMCHRHGAFGNYINKVQQRVNANASSTEMETRVLEQFMKMGKRNCKYGSEEEKLILKCGTQWYIDGKRSRYKKCLQMEHLCEVTA